MDDDTHLDPVPGTPEYNQLDRDTQYEICMRRVGSAPSKDGAFTDPGQPYAAGDPLPNPIDDW
jgi:hypothetical protein